jgi:diaminopimelate decarboxylase
VKKTYEKPVILKLETGHINKFGNNPYYFKRVRDNIDGVSVDELTARYGSPVFVFSERRLRRRYREVYDAFATRYPDVLFGWSYKTNYLGAICSVFHQEGAVAEVVSEMEYDKARAMGIPGSRIIFNGPGKSRSILEKAALEKAMIHVDHLDEIRELELVADKLDRKISIGLRVNLDTGIFPQWSRFGFNFDSGQALDVVKRIHNGGKLVLNGLHCHIGTYILEPNAYAKAVEKMLTLVRQIRQCCNFTIDYLDLGGGFPSHSRLKGSYMPPDVAIPGIDEYAEQITSALYKHLEPGHYPRLILETGRALVDEAGFLITSILAAKRLPDGRKAYVADAGLNLLFTSFWYKLNIEIDREIQGMKEPSVVYGPLCMNIDVIDEGSLLPPLRKDTRLIVSPVGAYNVTQWMQFIEYRPNVVLIGEDGGVDVIREKEDLSDILRREKVPDRLKLQAKIPA